MYFFFFQFIRISNVPTCVTKCRQVQSTIYQVLNFDEEANFRRNNRWRTHVLHFHMAPQKTKDNLIENCLERSERHLSFCKIMTPISSLRSISFENREISQGGLKKEFCGSKSAY